MDEPSLTVAREDNRREDNRREDNRREDNRREGKQAEGNIEELEDVLQSLELTA